MREGGKLGELVLRPMMMKSNREKGAEFRDAARPIAEAFLGISLTPEVGLPIGDPPKRHAFDLVGPDANWVMECKNLEWREGGGVPNAQITSITEAARLLQALRIGASRAALLVNRATHPKRRETLAEYYVRLNQHLLGDVALGEVDLAASTMRWLVPPSKHDPSSMA